MKPRHLFAVTAGALALALSAGAVSAGGVVKTVSAPFPLGADVNQATGRLYVTGSGGVVSVIARPSPVTIQEPTVFVFPPGVSGGVDPAHDKYEVVATIPLPNINLGRIAVDQVRNRVYVGGSQPRELYAIDGATNTLVGKVALSESPGRLAVDALTGRVLVAHGSADQLTVVEPLTLEATTITTVKRGAGIAVDPVGRRIFLSHYNEGSITVLNADSFAAAAPITATQPGPLTFDGGANRLYATVENGKLLVVDAAAMSPVKTVDTGMFPVQVVSDPVADRIYVVGLLGGISVFDRAAVTSLGTIHTNAWAADMAIEISRGRLFTTTMWGDSVKVVAP